MTIFMTEHDLLNPHVFIQDGRKYSLGFKKDDWLTKPHNPEFLKLILIVEPTLKEPNPK